MFEACHLHWTIGPWPPDLTCRPPSLAFYCYLLDLPPNLKNPFLPSATPPDQVHPLTRYTPRTRYTPTPRPGTPPGPGIPPGPGTPKLRSGRGGYLLLLCRFGSPELKSCQSLVQMGHQLQRFVD